MPTPVSSISNRSRRRWPGNFERNRRASRRPSEVNFTALPIRLNRAWRSRTGSAWTQWRSPPICTSSVRPLATASCRSRSATPSSRAAGSSGSSSSSMRPASILEMSITSLSSCDSIRPHRSASSSIRLASELRLSPPSRCSTPSTPFIGVRISWLILARNWVLASTAAWASRSASISANSWRLRVSMSSTTPVKRSTPPSALWCTTARASIHRYAPFGRRIRHSAHSLGLPCRERSMPAFTMAASSGCMLGQMPAASSKVMEVPTMVSNSGEHQKV